MGIICLVEIGLTDLSRSGGSILPPTTHTRFSDGSAGQGDGHPAANFLPTKDHGIRLESSMAPAYLAYTFRNLSSYFLEPQNWDLKTEEIAKNFVSFKVMKYFVALEAWTFYYFSESVIFEE